MNHVLCIFSPVSCATTSIAKATLGDVFNALTAWILNSVQWLLAASGHVLTSSSEPSTVVDASTKEFTSLLTISPILMIIGLMVATLQALRHGDASSLWRVYFGVAPACVLGVLVARPMALIILRAVNELSGTAAASVVQDESKIVSTLTSLSSTSPAFGLFLLAAGVVLGSWLLWCELVLRTVVLALLLVVVPIVVPLSTFPSLRRLGIRLSETFLAVAASKFLIVIALTLGFNELTGDSASLVIVGAVTLMLASFSPYVLLRLIPFVEQSAVHNMEGVRRRFTQSVSNAPSSPAVVAARALMPEVPTPSPEDRPEDLGLAMWDSSPEVSVPTSEGPRPDPPIGTPQLRGGHVVLQSDELGPVLGWHFDE